MTLNEVKQQKISLTAEQGLAGLLLLLIVTSVVNLMVVLQPAQALARPSTEEQTLITLTNEQRRAKGLKELSYNPRLTKAATAKAQDMLANGYFEHVSPQGKTPWEFMKQADYDYLKAGENLAIDFTTLEDPVVAWMESPSHRANILKEDYEDIGIAVVKGQFQGRETVVIVQMFGTRPFSIQTITQAVAPNFTF